MSNDIHLNWRKPEAELPKPDQKVLVIVKQSDHQRRTMDIGIFRKFETENFEVFSCSYLQAGLTPDQIEAWIPCEEVDV